MTSQTGQNLWIQAYEFSTTTGSEMKSYWWELESTDGIQNYPSAPALPAMREYAAEQKFHPMQFGVASNEKTVVYHRTHNCHGRNETTYSSAYKEYKDNLNIQDPNPYDDQFFAECVSNQTNVVIHNEVEAWQYNGRFWEGPSFYF